MIPNILKIAQKFMDHEYQLIQDITELRTNVMASDGLRNDDMDAERLDQRFKLESNLNNKLSSLMVAVESYPELKSQESMIQAQMVFADVEEHISAARRSFNAANTALRNAIEIPPGNIIAKIAGVQPLPFFEISSTDREPVNADAYLK